MSNSDQQETVIDFQNVSKTYAIYDAPGDRLTELLSLGLIRKHRRFDALQDLSFQVWRGETFCVIGENGSGKSTMLQIIAGILSPTAGSSKVEGRVAALLELGSGFNPDFSGRDNVFLNASILGLSHEETKARFQSIADFAEIGDFLEQPVKTYSSGMAVRLAFSVAIHVDPQILLVDEALAVGDIYFRQRCMRKVHELRERGVTILFVSHSMGDVKAIGDRVLWLDHGKLKGLGSADEVVPLYMAAMATKDSAYLDQKPKSIASSPAIPHSDLGVVTEIPNIDHRHGDERAKILGIAILQENGQPCRLLEPDSVILVRISAQAVEAISCPNIGFMLRNHMGVDFAGTNTLREGHSLPPLNPGDILTVDFRVTLPTLYPSHFSFSPAIADGDLLEYKMCDWIDNAITLQMGHTEGPVYGYLHLPCRVEIGSTVRSIPQSELTNG
ncbi:MAG: ABC transporter ATP-binding protein [Bryobacter sp.]|nr:ABC transporter ATP-binding protein [Bryobacter sp.]